jgi:hypothetical protein
MSPFVDPESSTQAGEWTIRTAYEHGLGYLVPAFLGWLLSRMRVAKRVDESAQRTAKQITDLGLALRTEMTTMKKEIVDRLEDVERGHRSLGQEMWGPHGRGGITSRLESMERRIDEISRSASAIEAGLDALLSRKS